MIDPAVARSEAETGFRNAALANCIRSFGNLHNHLAHVLGVYFHQYAYADLRPLRRVGRFRANGNSQLGSMALELLAQRAGWSVFGP